MKIYQIERARKSYLRLLLGSLLFEASWVLSAGHCISSDFYKERNIS
jgi:hypothetical protein